MKILATLAVFIVLVAGGLYFYMFRSPAAPTLTAETANTQTIEPEPTIPETSEVSNELRRYENKSFRFALNYPKELSVRDSKNPRAL